MLVCAQRQKKCSASVLEPDRDQKRRQLTQSVKNMTRLLHKEKKQVRRSARELERMKRTDRYRDPIHP